MATPPPPSTPTEAYFTFTVGYGVEREQLRVTVYRPRSTGIPIVNSASERDYKPNDAITRTLLNMLRPRHIEVIPAPTGTLVSMPTDGRIRIDTQPAAPSVFRNIHIQNGRNRATSRTYAVTTIENGGELCGPVGYEHKLLKYLKEGLYRSICSDMKFNIRVKIETRKKPRKEWKGEVLAKNALFTLRQAVKERLKPRARKIVAKRFTSAKNVSKILRASEFIEHIATAIEKNVAKLVEKEGAHMVAKKIPIVSTFMGIFFGAMRASKGDFAGAFAEVASGVLADIPGPGTAASVAIDVGLMAKDIKEAIDDEKNHKKLLQHEVEQLKQENEEIQQDLHQLLPESEIYGEGESYYSESELGNVDDIVKIHIRYGDLIHAIQVEYRHSGKAAYHGGNGGEFAKTLSLDPDERIIKVEVSTYLGAVSSLSFHTDTGQSESFGMIRQDVEEYEMTDGAYLASIKGFDLFVGGTKQIPAREGNYEVIPAIGFVAKILH